MVEGAQDLERGRTKEEAEKIKKQVESRTRRSGVK